MTNTSESICDYMDLEVFRHLISRDPFSAFPEENDAFEIMTSSVTPLQFLLVPTFNDLLYLVSVMTKRQRGSSG